MRLSCRASFANSHVQLLRNRSQAVHQAGARQDGSAIAIRRHASRIESAFGQSFFTIQAGGPSSE
jgi:hypothetical protein